MITRSTAYTGQGGDTVQALQTARSLQAYGISVDIRLTNEQIRYDNYQLLHFFNISRPADILYHVRKTSTPFVVSTILTNYSEYDRLHRMGLPGLVFRYLPQHVIEYLKSVFRWISGTDNMMSALYLVKGQKRSILEIIKKAALLLPNSFSEHRRLKQLYHCRENCLVIPNGVDVDLFKFDRQRLKDPLLVICVARIEGIKNQLNLIRALNNSAYRLLIIGAPAPNQHGYYQACRKIAADNVSFLEHLPQEELVSYYQQAKVHVLPSWFETTGLSSLEAAAMGCNIVITDKGDTREYFGNDAFYCDPASPESIYAAVERAAATSYNEKLLSKISTLYTWHRAGRYTAIAYKKIIRQSWH